MGWRHYFGSNFQLQFYDDTKTYGTDTGATTFTNTGSSLTFAAITAGTNATITDSRSGFSFVSGEMITVRGSGSNDGEYHVIEASSSVLRLHMNHDLVNEIVSPFTRVTIKSYLLGTFPDDIHNSVDVVSKTSDCNAYFDEMVLCDGTFTVTLPDIGSPDVGKQVIISNVGTGTITVDGNGSDTLYDELDMECISDATLLLRATSTSTWRLS